MRRREFITLLGGAATVAWPLAVRAQQQHERMRRIGILMNLAADDPQAQARVAAFLQGLQEAGWAVGRNVQIDIRWGDRDAERNRKNVAELVALTPDAVLGTTFPIVRALQEAGPRGADRFCGNYRASRRGIGREPRPAWWSHHRNCRFRIRHEREMA
jgi:putative ABC transport system substrate-binding protein